MLTCCSDGMSSCCSRPTFRWGSGIWGTFWPYLSCRHLTGNSQTGASDVSFHCASPAPSSSPHCSSCTPPEGQSYPWNLCCLTKKNRFTQSLCHGLGFNSWGFICTEFDRGRLVCTGHKKRSGILGTETQRII